MCHVNNRWCHYLILFVIYLWSRNILPSSYSAVLEGREREKEEALLRSRGGRKIISFLIFYFLDTAFREGLKHFF